MQQPLYLRDFGVLHEHNVWKNTYIKRLLEHTVYDI